MAYTDFSLADLGHKFGIQNQKAPLFQEVKALNPSDNLLNLLKEAQELPVRSEKAKSEWIVVPVLRELRNANNKFFTIYSGDTLNADESVGLKGECDFIIAKETGSFDLNYPILQLVEAKKNDIEIGVPQCAAQMVGAKIYNQKQGVILDKVYGCVTTGNEWLFLCLAENLTIDTRLYYLNEIPLILGVFQEIIDYFKKNL